MIASEGQVLTMLEATAGQEDGQIRVVVGVGVPHVAAEQDHRAVQQTIFTFTILRKL